MSIQKSRGKIVNGCTQFAPDPFGQLSSKAYLWAISDEDPESGRMPKPFRLLVCRLMHVVDKWDNLGGPTVLVTDYDTFGANLISWQWDYTILFHRTVRGRMLLDRFGWKIDKMRNGSHSAWGACWDTSADAAPFVPKSMGMPVRL